MTPTRQRCWSAWRRRETGACAPHAIWTGDIWEVRVDGDRVIYRVLFAEEGSRGQVLLALEGFNKKTQRTPPAIVRLAKTRLADWRRRGDQKREARGGRPLHR
ncbi:MAG TPA: type II toxin-antitoxin system RelE/ParE family toxin [Solirubrobacteraceae bacterium]|nr:type II toxin-antitoxin system RelE/ParE family toxin [Solirubrobacteraceae bacterium]